jgi:hypothetical protein
VGAGLELATVSTVVPELVAASAVVSTVLFVCARSLVEVGSGSAIVESSSRLLALREDFRAVFGRNWGIGRAGHQVSAPGEMAN